VLETPEALEAFRKENEVSFVLGLGEGEAAEARRVFEGVADSLKHAAHFAVATPAALTGGEFG
jgi:hypothetical protein